MAAVLCRKMVNLGRFRAVLGQHCMLFNFNFSHNYLVNQNSHFKQRYEWYTRIVAKINMPSLLTQSIKTNVSRRSFVRSGNGKHTKVYRANKAIKTKHVRLIDQDGKNLGIITLNEALEKGRKENCMVVEVGRTSSETVCKLISQQQLYEKTKEEKKKRVKTSKMKEIKVTGKISEHDLDIKLKKIIEFLEDRDSVKVFVAHRRIQNTSEDDKKALIRKIAEQISDVGCLQGEAKIVGRGVRAIFVPLQRK